MNNLFEIIIWLFVIVQQPPTEDLWVSSESNAVTHWEYVDSYNVYGLLAHDYLAGQYFYSLRPGDLLVANNYEYTVSDIRFYDGSIEDEIIFDEIYKTPDRLVLQTCWSDGFMFVIGSPTGEYNEKYDDELAFIKDPQWSRMFSMMNNYSLR
jgi:hypothetical protein